ncbi:hypothetical protein H1R20_g14731, partial [Candolleomyces eurysporus]
MVSNTQEFHRFRNTALDFSPFTSLGDLNSATCQLSSRGSVPKHTTSTSSSASNAFGRRARHSTGAASTDTTPAYEESNRGEHHELEHYSNLDVERETFSSRFTQCVELSLEDFFHGKQLLYSFTKKLLGGKTLRQTLNVVVPPGCPKDTVYCFPDVGHQLSDDLFQEIHLIFVEKAHPLGFKRVGHDISTLLRLPWTESLEEGPRRFTVTGIDGKKYAVEIDYRFSKMVAGSVTFYKAGMPRPDGKGKGKFTIDWEIYWPPSPCED